MESLVITKTMSSREIAELTGKQHKDVLEAIRKMETAWYKITERKFPLSEYTDTTGRKLPMYELNKTECLYIATKFNDEARAKLIVRWEELEKKQSIYSIPQSYSEALKLAADQAEKIENQQKQIETQKPKVLFADAVATSHKSCLVSDLAKMISQNGISIGQNRLFHWLRDKGYLCNRGESYNKPSQRAMELGLFEIKTTTISKPDGTILVNTTPKVTGKGQIYFIDKFLNK